MYDIAYYEVKSNLGMMTPGSTGETPSGWGPETINKIIESLSNESFSFTVARTTKIPKATGGTRTLKIASPKDKIVQRIIAYILEAIYEPSFSEQSFGFRPGKGVHDALQYVKYHFRGVRWVIEGDISKCFDEIDHHVLVGILRKRIKDERFIRLIWKALRAG
jgi:retron-type reverse transcriptase